MRASQRAPGHRLPERPATSQCGTNQSQVKTPVCPRITLDLNQINDVPSFVAVQGISAFTCVVCCHVTSSNNISDFSTVETTLLQNDWFWSNPVHHFLCVSHMKVRRDHRGEPKSPLQAAPVEQPAEQLQGAEGPGGGTPQQPQGEPDAVQQTSETCQHHQSCECISTTSLSLLLLASCFL